MNWLNIHTDTLRSEEYLGAVPIERATWLNLLAWCATQENGGVIEGAREWGERKWMQLCGITQAEAAIESQLYFINPDGDMVVSLYPREKEDEVRIKRKAGKIGGKASSKAKSAAAKANGKKGGRPITQAETQAETKHNPSGNPREGKGKRIEGEGEGEGKKRVATPPKPPAPLALPHGNEFSAAWDEWTKHRTEIKKPLKPTSTKRSLVTLAALTERDAVAMIHHTVANGWQGLREPENKSNNRTNGRPNRNQGTALGKPGQHKRTAPLPSFD